MYSKFLKLHVKTSMQYRGNMLFVALSQVFITIGEILGTYFLFLQFESVGGWNFFDTMILSGIMITVFGINECFFRGYDTFADLIKHGKLDSMLVRPMNIHYQIICGTVEFSKFGRVLLGIAITIVGLTLSPISWTFLKVLVLLMTFVCGVVVFLGINMISSGISVFSVNNLEFMNIFTDGSKRVGKYPLNIYNKFLSIFFTFVIPLACFNYLPISYILDKPMTSEWLYALSPLFGLVFFLPCLLFLNWSLKRYASTGS